MRAAIVLALAASAAAWAADPAAALEPSALPAISLTEGPNCVSAPDWQAHEYNDDFYILRESGCIHSEKPFLYLIFGKQNALLEDAGAGDVQTAPLVMSLLQKWPRRRTGHRLPSS